MRAVVVLATHNPRPDLLLRQVESLRAQTVEDWQCLVFDDASDDRRVVESAVDDDPRFTLLDPLEAQVGHNRAFEILLEAAVAHDAPVFLCDQDDHWSPKKMHYLLDQIDGGAGAAFSAMAVVDEVGHPVRDRFLPGEPQSDWLSPASLLRMNCVSGTSMAVSRDVVRAALPFPAPHLRGWHDQWLAAVAARTSRLAYLDEPFTDYTQHTGQVIGDGLRAVNLGRLRKFVTEKRSLGLLMDDLRSRTGWIAEAAQRLLQLSDAPDPQLQTLASNRADLGTVAWLWDGVRHGDVPAYRALLLAAGFAIS